MIDLSLLEAEAIPAVEGAFQIIMLAMAGEYAKAGIAAAELAVKLVPADSLKQYLDPGAVDAINKAADAAEKLKVG